MKMTIHTLTSDAEAEKFLAQDLSDLDFSQFTPVQFEFEPKSERVNMRLPKTLLTAVKDIASREGALSAVHPACFGTRRQRGVVQTG